jgi:hypothetical protein
VNISIARHPRLGQREHGMFDNYSMQNFDDYFIQEEFIFPEHGGVTGMRNVGCPCCEARYELAVDEGNTADAFRCDSCGFAKRPPLSETTAD